MKSNLKFKESYEIVKIYLHQIDPYGLLEGGSPEDEFDSEINAITKQLERCKSGRDISHSIARVLNSSFSENYSPDSFLTEGEKIYEQLKEKNLI